MALKTQILSSLNSPTGTAFPIQAWSSQTWSDLPSLSQEQIQWEAQHLSKPAGSIVPRQVSHYLSTKKIHTIAYYVLSWLTWPFHVRWSTKPPRHFHEFIGIPVAIGYFWESIKKGYGKSNEMLHKWFGVTPYHLKVFVIAYLGLCVLARWIEQWSGIVQSVELAQKEYRNLTAEVRDNPVHLLTTQRSVQIGQIALALTDMDSKAASDQFPMLVGPPGTGKTSAILNLVYQVEKLNQYPALRGKTFYSVNTAQWAFQKKDLTEGTRDSEWSEYGKQVVSAEPLLAFLKIIEGKESNTVVFFDEAQCFDDACIELLKTRMVERKLKVIFATTQKEYEKKFANNFAFADRLKKIDFPTLSDEETENVLEHLFFDERTPLEIEKKALSKIVQRGHELSPERANPRLSIQLTEQVIKTIQNWSPTVQRDALQKLQIEKLSLQNRCSQQILRGEDVQEVEKIKEKNQTLPTLESTVKEVDQLYHEIKGLQRQLGNEQQQLIQMAGRIVQQNSAISEDYQAQYRITKYVIRVIREQIQEKAQKFQEKAKEEYPVKITENWVNTILKQA